MVARYLAPSLNFYLESGNVPSRLFVYFVFVLFEEVLVCFLSLF